MSQVVRDKRFLKKAVRLLEDKKIESICAYDLKEINPYVDFTLVATCMNPPQMKAALGAIQEAAPEATMEGAPESGWVILDAGRVVVHLLSAQRREYYRLDQLWHSYKLEV